MEPVLERETTRTPAKQLKPKDTAAIHLASESSEQLTNFLVIPGDDTGEFHSFHGTFQDAMDNVQQRVEGGQTGIDVLGYTANDNRNGTQLFAQESGYTGRGQELMSAEAAQLIRDYDPHVREGLGPEVASAVVPVEIRQHAVQAAEALDGFMKGKSIPEVALIHDYEPGQAEIFLRSVGREYGVDELRGLIPADIFNTLEREPSGQVDRISDQRRPGEQQPVLQTKSYADSYHESVGERLSSLELKPQGKATLLAEAQLIQTQLRDPATASEALEAQASNLQRTMNAEAAHVPSAESAALRSAADGVETDRLTAEERREELADKAEVYAGLVARDYRTATDAAVEKFASGVRNGSSEIDLSEAYEVPGGVSIKTAESMARTRHESVGAALQPLFSEAESLGIRVRLGSASLAQANQIQEVLPVGKRGIRI